MSDHVCDLNGCARCDGEGHPQLAFHPFTQPVESEDGEIRFTHWALCPTNGEPILMGFLPAP